MRSRNPIKDVSSPSFALRRPLPGVDVGAHQSKLDAVEMLHRRGQPDPQELRVNLLEEYRLIDLREVMAKTALGRTSIYQLVKEGTFPSPVKVGAASRWVQTEVASWVQQLMLARSIPR